jgi:hypothetical protein
MESNRDGTARNPEERLVNEIGRLELMAWLLATQ